jgi:hypothetical protein
LGRASVTRGREKIAVVPREISAARINAQKPLA